MNKSIFKLLKAAFCIALLLGLLACGALAEGTAWQYRIDDAGFAHITAYNNAEAKSAYIPEQIDGHGVVGVDSGAFAACAKLEKLQVPGCVSILEDGALPEGAVVSTHHGSAAYTYAQERGMEIDNLSLLSFLDGVKDLSDLNELHYRVSGSTVQLDALNARRIEKGDIFYLQVKNGVAYKAVSFTEGDDGWVSIRTSQPAVDLVVSELSFHETEFYVDYSGIEILNDNVTFTPARTRSMGDLNGNFNYKFNENVSVEFAVKGAIENLSIDFGGLFQLENFDCEFTNSYTVKIKSAASKEMIDPSVYSDKVDNGWIDMVRVPFASALGTITADMVIRCKLDLEAGIEVEFGLTDVHNTISYSPEDGWQSSSGGGNKKVEAKGSAKLEFVFGPAIAINIPLVNDIADIGFNVSTSAEGKIAYDSENPETLGCIDLDCALKCYISASAGVEKKLPGMNKKLPLRLEYQSPPLEEWTKSFHLEDLKIVEECTKKNYTITFITGNGEILPDQTISSQNVRWSLPILAREGYEFTSWYYDAACTEKVGYFNPTRANESGIIVLYAGWKPLQEVDAPEYEKPNTDHIQVQDIVGWNFSKQPSNYNINGKTYSAYLATPVNRVSTSTNIPPAGASLWVNSPNFSTSSISYPANTIGTSGTFANTVLRSVSFPDTMMDIGSFSDCVNLSNVTLPSSLQYLNMYAFRNCPSLGEIRVPASCRTIAHYAFNGYSASSVYMAEGVEEIYEAFVNSYNLVRVNVPASVTSGSRAFEGCIALSDVHFEEGYETVFSSMFENCKSLKELTLPASLKEIRSDAFKDSGLENIKLQGEGLTIQPRAFTGSKLKSFEGNVSDAEMGGAFYNTPCLESVTLTGDDINLGDNVFSSSAVKRITIQATGTVTLSADTFRGADQLESLSISAKEIFCDRSRYAGSSLCLTDIRMEADKITFVGPNSFDPYSFGYQPNLENLSIEADEIAGLVDLTGCYDLKNLVINGRLENAPKLHCVAITELEIELANGNLTNLNDAHLLEKMKVSGEIEKVNGSLEGCISLEEIDLREVDGLKQCDMSRFGPAVVYLPDDVETVIGGSGRVCCKKGSRTATACAAAGVPCSEPDGQWYTLTMVYGNGYMNGSTSFGGGSARMELYEPADTPDYRFAGWYTDAAFTKPYDSLSAMPNSDLTVYAKWELKDASQAKGVQRRYLPGGGTMLMSYTGNDRRILPVSDTEIGDNCFSSPLLQELILGKEVKSIGANAFEGATALKKITVDSANPNFYVSDGALLSRDGVLIAYPPRRSADSLTLPKGITTIASGAFGSIAGSCFVEEIFLPDSVKTIEPGALTGLSRRTLVYGPENAAVAEAFEAAGIPYNQYTIVFMIDGEAVYAVQSRAGDLLPTISSPQVPGREFLGWGASENGKPINPDSFEMPHDHLILYALWKGDNGRVSSLPAALKNVGKNAFAGSDVQTVVCPEGLESIGSRAFANCSRLSVIQIPDSVTSIAADAFDGSVNVVIYASEGSYAAAYAREQGIAWKNS